MGPASLTSSLEPASLPGSPRAVKRRLSARVSRRASDEHPAGAVCYTGRRRADCQRGRRLADAPSCAIIRANSAGYRF